MESNIGEVLNGSNIPSEAAGFDFSKIAANSSFVTPEKLFAASNAWSSTARLSNPVMTTAVRGSVHSASNREPTA